MVATLLSGFEGTLVQGGRVAEHARDALGILRALRTVRSPGLSLGVVLEAPPAPSGTGSSGRAGALEDCIVALEALDLLEFFQPVARHVTLVSRGDDFPDDPGPDARAFEAALRRAGCSPDVTMAMFVTGRASHAAMGRALGMTVWQLGVDIDDWSTVPLVVSQAAGIVDPVSLLAPLNLRLEAVFDVRMARIDRRTEAPRALCGPSAGDEGAPLLVTLSENGDVAAVHRLDRPAREAAYYAALEDNAAVAPPGGPLPPGATHVLDPSAPGGQPLPRRRRYSVR